MENLFIDIGRIIVMFMIYSNIEIILYHIVLYQTILDNMNFFKVSENF